MPRDASSAERAAAEWKMQELNAAWEVVRDPAQRQAYDRRRPASTDRPGSRPVASPVAERAPLGASALVGRPDGVPDLEPEIEGAPTVVRRTRWSAYGPVIVVGAVAGVLVVVFAVVAIVSGPAPENVETTERFPTGSCVVVTESRLVEEAVCGSVGAVSVVGREAFPRPCPIGTAAIVMLELNQSLCVESPTEPGTPTP